MRFLCVCRHSGNHPPLLCVSNISSDSLAISNSLRLSDRHTVSRFVRWSCVPWPPGRVMDSLNTPETKLPLPNVWHSLTSQCSLVIDTQQRTVWSMLLCLAFFHEVLRKSEEREKRRREKREIRFLVGFLLGSWTQEVGNVRMPTTPYSNPGENSWKNLEIEIEVNFELLLAGTKNSNPGIGNVQIAWITVGRSLKKIGQSTVILKVFIDNFLVTVGKSKYSNLNFWFMSRTTVILGAFRQIPATVEVGQSTVILKVILWKLWVTVGRSKYSNPEFLIHGSLQ